MRTIKTTTIICKCLLCLCLLISISNKAQGNNPIMGSRFTTAKQLSFIENRGQIKDMAGNKREDILFKGSSGNAQIYLRSTGISYVIANYPHIVSGKLKNAFKKDIDTIKNKIVKGCRIDVNFLHCNTHCTIGKEQATDEYTNYYLPACPNGILGAKAYQRITYHDIYPHIDFVIYTTGKGMEYDFIVNEGGNPDDIKLKYEGADDLDIDKNGNLKVKFAIGQIIESAPKVFLNQGSKSPVPSSFMLDKENGLLSFHINNYQHKPLRIDPKVMWSTYLGGSDEEYLSCMAIDKNGNVLVTGGSKSTDFPISSGAFQYNIGDIGKGDMIICKFTAKGKLLWSTYFGGSDADYVTDYAYNNGPGIAADGNGNVIVAGTTKSTDLPVTNDAYQSSYLGYQDAFLAKFDASGQRLWATYFGDNNATTGASAVGVDKANNIYFAGAAAAYTNKISGSDTTYVVGNISVYLIVIAKFSPDGHKIRSQLYGSGRIKGEGVYTPTQYASDIAIDDSCNVVVYGAMEGGHFPLKNNKIDRLAYGPPNSFILKFDSAGVRQWAAAYGSSTYSVELAVDKHGNIYITGATGSGYIDVKNAYQSTYGGGQGDVFLAKIGPKGDLLYSTYLGGSGLEQGYGITADAYENVTVTGFTFSNDFPIKNAIQPALGASGAMNGFVSKFNKAGNLVWSTYYGGTYVDNPTDVQHDELGNLYVCGVTYSKDYPTDSAYQSTYDGKSDGFITKIYDCNNAYSDITWKDGLHCQGDSVLLTLDPGLNSIKWNTGDTTRSIKAYKTGNYSATITTIGGCPGQSAQVSLFFYSKPKTKIVASGTLNFCDGDSVVLTSSGVYPSYAWSDGEAGPRITAKKAGQYILTAYSSYNFNGCSTSDTVMVTLKKRPRASIKATPGLSLCKTGSVTLDAGPGYTHYHWSSGDTTQKITVQKADSFYVEVDSAAGCKTRSAWVKTTLGKQAKIISNKVPFTCAGDTILLDAGPGYASYKWKSGETTETIKAYQSGRYNVLVKDTAGCYDSAKAFYVTVYPAPSKPVITKILPNLISTEAYRYQWYWNGSPLITSGKKQILSNVLPGVYEVQITDSNGCKAISDTIDIVKQPDTTIYTNDCFSIYPNPTSDKITIEICINQPSEVKYLVTDIFGRKVMDLDDGMQPKGVYKKYFSFLTLAPDVYVVQVYVRGFIHSYKIVYLGNGY